MASFVKDITSFYGTGARNDAGQTLEEFLDVYDPYKYKTPSCTTDAVVFSYTEKLSRSLEGLKILLVQRSNHPSIGFWALPGGFIELEENLEDTARRELEEETGVKDLTMEQIAVYGDWDRDPRARIITTAYMALVRESDVKVQAGDDAADAAWCRVSFERLDSVQQGKQKISRYRLRVENTQKQVFTEAVVKRVVRGNVIREEKFTVEERGMLASDHAAIIVQALLKLQERLEDHRG
ncbi:MAG: NUDIX hydrolase [Hespellia sp.]|nr:NUDIX hydrolase [Hespellia sp.]